MLRLAAHVIVPVDVRSLRVVAPGPDMQLEERIDVEAVRRSHIVEDLPLEDRRRVVVVRQPSCGVDNELHADEPQRAVALRFIISAVGRAGFRPFTPSTSPFT